MFSTTFLNIPGEGARPPARPTRCQSSTLAMPDGRGALVLDDVIPRSSPSSSRELYILRLKLRWVGEILFKIEYFQKFYFSSISPDRLWNPPPS